ncbi:MAG: SHOCT domain-containing protein [Acidiferrobacterales bacterium]
MIFGSLMMVLFWGGVIIVVVLLVRWLSSGSTGMGPPPAGKTALDILKERFVRGEIDKEEFEERKRLLSD